MDQSVVFLERVKQDSMILLVFILILKMSTNHGILEILFKSFLLSILVKWIANLAWINAQFLSFNGLDSHAHDMYTFQEFFVFPLAIYID